MSKVDEQARHEYRQGQNDEKMPQPEKTVRDIVGDHPDTPAYYKGRSGEPLDKDKGNNK